MNADSAIEARALRFALFAYSGLAVLGITFASITGSEAILLDGSFNAVSLLLGLAALHVAKLQDVDRSQHFHFGHAHFEPLLNTVRVLMVLGVSAFALHGAIGALFRGGVAISAGPAMAYGIVATAACLLAGLHQKKAAQRSGSVLLAVDAESWILNSGVSAASALAFLLAYLLDGSAWAHVVPYVDPALVILLLLILVWVPLRSLFSNVGELLWVAPDPAMQARVEAAVEGALGELPSSDMHLRMVRVGRTFYLMAHLVLPSEHRVESIGALDAIRERIVGELRDLEPRLAVDVIFTGDVHWATALDARLRVAAEAAN